MKKLLLSIALVAAAFQVSSAATAVKRIELFRYNLNDTTETFVELDPAPGIAGTALIQAAASTTVTAVSGTPFANVSVGDVLIVTNSDGQIFMKNVNAKASSVSITVNTPAITLTNAAFKWRKLQKGTADTNGSFPTDGYSALTVQVTVDQLNLASGGIDIRLQCRAMDNVAGVEVDDWAPAYPVAVPPAAQVPFNVTAVGSYLLTSIGVYSSCRVGLRLTGADDGVDTALLAEQITIISIGAPR